MVHVAQVSSKIDVIKTLLEKADKVIIVGGMVFTFDKAADKAVRHAHLEISQTSKEPENLLPFSTLALFC